MNKKNDDELQRVEDAEAVVAEFAFSHGVSGSKAREHAKTWFDRGRAFLNA